MAADSKTICSFKGALDCFTSEDGIRHLASRLTVMHSRADQSELLVAVVPIKQWSTATLSGAGYGYLGVHCYSLCAKAMQKLQR